MPRRRVDLQTAEETVSFGSGFSSELKANQILALRGDLGAGKTTFVQGLLKGLSISDTAQSPTFTYLQIYQGAIPIYHFDLYRLKNESDFIYLGFEDCLYAGGIAVIEWPERISSIIPDDAHLIEMSHSPSGRIALVDKWGSR